MNNIWILAANEGFDETASPVTEDEVGTTMTTVASDPNSVAGSKPRGLFGQYGNFIFFGLMFVLFYFIVFRGPRKKQQEHRQMVQSLAKNDKIRTIGGIIGTVVDIKDDEITLKVDESNNTKIKIAASAIGRNVTKDKS